ncbi:MAG: transposase family protein [Bacteroidia bacterium]
MMDLTERIVPRRSGHSAQKAEYSGKKKQHTIKNLALSDPDGYVHFLSEAYEGSVHDKAIWDELTIAPLAPDLLAGLGFLGISKTQPNAILPDKKTRNRALTDEQKHINRIIASLRVRIEHAFAGIKRLKIIRNKIRLKCCSMRNQMMRITTALHNLRVQTRLPIQIQL